MTNRGLDESTEERDPLEVLAAEFVDRRRRGESPSIEEYARRCPPLANRIRDLFPTILAMEGLKSHAKIDPKEPDRPSPQWEGPIRMGDLRILREIGRGGMGVVYEAEQKSLKRRVAVKIIRFDDSTQSKVLRQFKSETRAAAGLHHSNIVPVFSAGRRSDCYYYVMQLIDGVGLDDLLESRTSINSIRPQAEGEANGSSKPKPAATNEMPETVTEIGVDAAPPIPRLPPFPIGDPHFAARIARQAAEALQYAHDRGTLHRDVKPGNLVLDHDGNLWVTDFGLAKQFVGEPTSRRDDFVGTVRYMAPERFEGRVDRRSDVYSLGVSLYELLTAEPAFGHTSKMSYSDLIRRIRAGQLASESRSRPDAPRDLVEVIRKATAVRPGDRYATAGEFAADLDRFLNGRPVKARRHSAVEQLGKWARRQPAVAALASFTLVLALSVAVFASYGYFSIRQALESEAMYRREAEDSVGIASDALDKVFGRFNLNADRGGDDSGQPLTAFVPAVVSEDDARLLQELLGFYDRLASENDRRDPAVRAKAAEARWRVGRIHHTLGHYEQAVSAYRDAITMYEAIESDRGDRTANRFEISRIRNEMGDALLRLRQYEGSRNAHLMALADLREALRASPDSAKLRCELARTHYLLGRELRPGEGPFNPPPNAAIFPVGDPRARPPARLPQATDAIEHLVIAITLLEDLLDEHPDSAEECSLLGNVYRELASDAPAQRTDKDAAAERKALDIFGRLVKENPKSPRYRYELMETLSELNVFGAAVDAASVPVAESNLRTARSIGEQLVEDYPHSVDYSLALIHTCFKLGRIVESQSDVQDPSERARRLHQAEQCYRQARDLQRFLVRRFPRATAYQVWLAMFQQDLARVEREVGRFAQSKQLLDESIRILTRDRNPADPKVTAMLANSYDGLQLTLASMGLEHQASEAERRSRSYRSELDALPIEPR